MAKFKHYDYNQMSMVVINYLEQIQPGTFEFALHYLISEKLDLTAFHQPYKNDTEGRPAYDPAILLKIILFAYSKGITSSREIQWCCETNIIFKALSCDTVPHFTTIAHFVSNRAEAIEVLFEHVLLICDQQGLLGHELFAIDGCKTRSNASKEWSGTFKELEQKRQKLKRMIQYHLNEHQEKDTFEGEETQERSARKTKTIQTLDAAANKIGEFLKQNQPRMGKAKRSKEVKSNITDPESAKMTTSKGTIQGYNSVATVDNRRSRSSMTSRHSCYPAHQHQIIIDAQAFGESQEHHTLKPVLESIKSRYQRLVINDNVYAGGVIMTADTGFANDKCVWNTFEPLQRARRASLRMRRVINMEYLHENQINGYIPDNQFRSRDPKFKDQKEKYGKRHQSQKNPTVNT